MLLEDTQLSGPLPECLGQMVGLQVLKLSGSRFLGPLPRGIGGMSSLRILDASNNRFSGALPMELCGFSIVSLSLGNNLFTALPNCTLESVVFFAAPHNRISAIPPNFWFSGLSSLRFLNLAHNKLTLSSAMPPPMPIAPPPQLPVPSSLNLRLLDLSNNPLNCTMSKFYIAFDALLLRVASLYLGGCGLSGNVLGNIKQWQSLYEANKLRVLGLLDLSRNSLSGNAFFQRAYNCPGLLSSPFLTLANFSRTHIEVSSSSLTTSPLFLCLPCVLYKQIRCLI